MTYLNSFGVSKETQMAWECAMSVGWQDSFDWVRRFMPTMWMLAHLMIQEQQNLKLFFAQTQPENISNETEKETQQ